MQILKSNNGAIHLAASLASGFDVVLTKNLTLVGHTVLK